MITILPRRLLFSGTHGFGPIAISCSIQFCFLRVDVHLVARLGWAIRCIRLDCLTSNWINFRKDEEASTVVIMMDQTHVLAQEHEHSALTWIEVFIVYGGRLYTSVDEEEAEDYVRQIEAVH